MTKKTVFSLALSCLLLFSGIHGTPRLSAQTDVPKEIASKVFLKVLKFDRTFQSADDPGVLVTYKSGDADVAKFYAEQFGGAGYRSQTVSLDSVGDQVANYQALLIASPGTDSTAYDEMTRSNSVLTISLDSSKVQNGSSSIGVKLVNEKPELLFNLERLNKEGHDIPSKVLKLGTVHGK